VRLRDSVERVYSQTLTPPAVITGAPSTPRKWPGPLDDAAFYGVAGEIVRRIEPHTEADPAALLICFLVAFGNAIGRGVYFLADGARHYGNLFAVLVGETSKGRKGTAWARVLQRLIGVAGEWAENRVTGGLSSGEGLIWQVRDPIHGTERDKKTKQTVTIVVDAGVADKRLMLVEAEFASVLRLVERQGNTLSAIVRKAWEAGNLRSLTKNSPAKATGAHVSIIGDVTVDELRRYLDRTEIANGFGNRFLWLCVRRSKCLPEGGQLDDDAFGDVTARIADAIAFARTEQQLYRNKAAKELWAKVYPDLSEGKLGLAGALTGRAEAQVMRLALVHAVLDCSSVIRVEHLTAGIALWEYCNESVTWCFGDATGDSVADVILNALRGVGEAGLTRTEVSDLLGRNVSATRIAQALAALKARQLAVDLRESTDGPGRPVERWFARASDTKETRKTKKGPTP